MLLYILATVLCAVYAADAVLVSFAYQQYSEHPHSSQLLFLVEVIKLLISVGQLAKERQNTSSVDHNRLALRGRGIQLSFKPTVHLLRQPSQVQLSRWFNRALEAAVPAVCYTAANNLSFVALQLMPPHTYALLCNLNTVATQLLGCLLLARLPSPVPCQSLGLLTMGVFVGCIPAGQAQAPQQQMTGVYVMAVVAALTAAGCTWKTATVQDDSTSSTSSDRRASTPLQGMTCLISAAVNVLLHMSQGGSASKIAVGLRSIHWAAVLTMAVAGVVTAALVKHCGDTLQAYAYAGVPMLSAAISQVLLQQQPGPFIYAGCVLTTVALWQLHIAQCCASGPRAHAHNKSFPWMHRAPQMPRAAATLPPVTCLLLLLLLAWRVPSERSPVHSSPAAFRGVSERVNHPLMPSQHQGRHDFSQVWAVTDAPMITLPPFEPACFPSADQKRRLNVPVMDCLTEATCSVYNSSCCAYFNMQMLVFFDSFLTSKCLQGEYFLVYGSALGSYRNSTILPHTNDLDLGLTPMAIRVLEQNATRAELWRHGYVFMWHGQRGVWKLWPHRDHPSPNFRAVMRFNETESEWARRTGKWSGAYLDAWLLWPVPSDTTRCFKSILGSTVDSIVRQELPWPPPNNKTCDNRSRSALGMYERQALVVDPPTAYEDDSGAVRLFCLSECAAPLLARPGSRPLPVAGLYFPGPENIERLLVSTYGLHWQSPDEAFHGMSVRTQDTTPSSMHC